MTNQELTLNNFLKGEENKGFIKEMRYGNSSRYTYFIKVNSGIEYIDLIYSIETNKKNILKLFENLKFVGIYHKTKSILYAETYSFIYSSLIETISDDFKLLSLNSLKNDLEKQIKDEVIKRVENNDELLQNVELSEEEIKQIQEESAPELALRLFMRNEVIDHSRLLLFFSLPETKYTEDLLLLYLDSSEMVIQEKAKEYIKKYDKHIVKTIITNNLAEKELEKMKRDNDLLENKKIYSILNSKDMKTVNVEFLKDDKIYQFKVETNYLSNDFNYIDSWAIVGNDNRNKFELLFYNTNCKACFDDIVKITYGKKVLYKRKNI